MTKKLDPDVEALASAMYYADNSHYNGAFPEHEYKPIPWKRLTHLSKWKWRDIAKILIKQGYKKVT